jgi:hypothetical protein
MKSSGAVVVDENAEGFGCASRKAELLTASRCPDKTASAPAKTQATRRRQEASARGNTSGKQRLSFQVVENTCRMVAGVRLRKAKAE